MSFLRVHVFMEILKRHFFRQKYMDVKLWRAYRSLLDVVMIGVEVGRDDHSSIPRNCDREETGTN
jgi:hypothetical protein